ncbi:hypothetical protein EJB05_29331 [Eragrostis curvula]|uniref:BZIP domain-containing protein n=1 Tax=Eragrostis curvula TaxID=38414 RepID=A0A5J9UUP6_9POAL|nr:hypothetical protein EJB05_29331 [Eragrostis curvula]
MDPRFPPPAPSSGAPFGAPPRGHHRRAHSESFIRLPDADLLLDPEGDFSFSDLDFPSLSDDSPSLSDPTPPPPPQQAAQPQQQASSPAPRHPGGGSGAHMRSLSLDAAFFDGLSLQGGGGGAGSGAVAGHKRSGSMDEGESALSGVLPDYAKKAVPAERLAELALLDPKRAKRILANRQSAARSKERKIKYTSELERKVQTLQTEATTLSAQLTLLQVGEDALVPLTTCNNILGSGHPPQARIFILKKKRSSCGCAMGGVRSKLCFGDWGSTNLNCRCIVKHPEDVATGNHSENVQLRDTSGLTAENRELKLRLQSMEEQAKLRDALNDALREEVQRLKIAAGQVPNMNGNPFNGGLPQQQQNQQQMASYFSQPQQMQYFGGQRPNHQPQNSSNGGRSLNDSMDFM